ncbi:MAG: hypothetical protein GY696_31830 [Gammaproteobacteria bacterium]|nr:hypothetical protein [Gammaproteobacteria bacterium]
MSLDGNVQDFLENFNIFDDDDKSAALTNGNYSSSSDSEFEQIGKCQEAPRPAKFTGPK